MMPHKILLLNSTYEVLHFTSEKNALKLIFKGKVEVISIWENKKMAYGSGYIEYPAILRMKYYVKRKFAKLIFSKTLSK